MKRRIKIILAGITVLSFVILYSLTQAQEEQKVTLRYKAKVDDIWKYECITETEKEHEISRKGYKEKHLQNIKENFKYQVLEVTSEGYSKVKLATTPVESKGVDIIAGRRSERHDFVAGWECEEIILNTVGEVLRLSYWGEPEDTILTGVDDKVVTTGTLLAPYEEIIKYFRPVIPQETVGINDAWYYNVYIIPGLVAGIENLVKYVFTPINYKVVAFEKKDGFDCVKIEYNYEEDWARGFDEWVKEMTPEQQEKWEKETIELKIEGKGTIYFAYNEGFLVSRKENLMMTSKGSSLINDKWTVLYKTTERIGFTMNYIKP